MPTDNGHSDGGLTTNERIYAPSFVGGNGGQALNPKGNNADPGNTATSQQVIVNPGEEPSTVPLGQVIDAASAQAANAMDAEHVPIGLRGVIREYFSGLQPSK